MVSYRAYKSPRECQPARAMGGALPATAEPAASRKLSRCTADQVRRLFVGTLCDARGIPHCDGIPSLLSGWIVPILRVRENP